MRPRPDIFRAVPEVWMQQLSPPLFAFALALLALTPENAKKKDRRPTPAVAPVERVAQLAGNCTVRRLTAPGPMPRRRVRDHMKGLAAADVFDAWDVRDGEVSWTWSADLHDAMAAGGSFVKVPKPLLWDSTLTGVEKLVYVAVHYGLRFREIHGWSSSEDQRVVISQDRYLTQWTGLAQSTISEALARLETFGLIHLQGARLGLPTALRLLPATVRYCWQDAAVGGRRLVSLWVPFDQAEVDYRRSHLVRVATETGDWKRGYPEEWWTTSQEGCLPRLLDAGLGLECFGGGPDLPVVEEPTPPTDLSVYKRKPSASSLAHTFAERAMATDVPAAAKHTMRRGLGNTIKKWNVEQGIPLAEIQRAMDNFFISPGQLLQPGQTLWLAFVNNFVTLHTAVTRTSTHDIDYINRPKKENIAMTEDEWRASVAKRMNP